MRDGRLPRRQHRVCEGIRQGQPTAPEPITGHTILDLGSTSKQFTAFSYCCSNTTASFSLNNGVGKYIPELQPLHASATLRDLMLNTSGLCDYLTLRTLAGMKTENWTTQDDDARIR